MASAGPDPERDSDEDEDDEGEEEEEETPFLPPPACLRARGSVSAEAFGEWNQRAAFQPLVYPKTQEQMDELTMNLSGSFLFNALDSKDLQTVILAMKGPLVLEPGMRIITEGASGDHLYVVADGAMDCMKVINGLETVVKTCFRGDLFGELALLYNCPRAASVVCREVATLWELDRETFNGIVMEAVQRKRAQCSSVLRRVPLFQGLSVTLLENIIDALKVETHPQGATIIEQGADGNEFFIVYEGQVVASRSVPEQPEPITFVHEAGDYFGELSLLRDEPRAATVVTATNVQLLSMDRATFKRLMGPAEEFLEREASRYN
eukprot:CAMPEP_0115307284 /NCGR_PEP_ID=MMETSP0270-20121206/73051_1 /TAXON_ID=71861 /ORGANISM="Scrippsiella trochoidea, Strain CCMP3099" /LENGTH=321 /DNA_ID=CAMNT_0002725701 /DNA_START=60 /DNA_END=1025 /DNA_ORIENTATION=-